MIDHLPIIPLPVFPYITTQLLLNKATFTLAINRDEYSKGSRIVWRVSSHKAQ